MIYLMIYTIAETGEYPKEIKLGQLTPLQKPGKPKGPAEKLRPVILLSTLSFFLFFGFFISFSTFSVYVHSKSSVYSKQVTYTRVQFIASKSHT